MLLYENNFDRYIGIAILEFIDLFGVLDAVEILMEEFQCFPQDIV